MLIILKGIAGSGKTTLRNKLLLEYGESNCKVFSADDEIVAKYGSYKWSPQAAREAHRTIQVRFTNDVVGDNSLILIVDNQNIKWADFSYYIRGAIECNHKIKIIETTTPWRFDAEELFKRNTHNVPLDAIKRNLANWQSREHIVATFNQNYPDSKESLEY